MLLKQDSQVAAVELLHDVRVADPYRWLENRQLPQTETWLAEQNRRSEDYFAGLPYFEMLCSRVRKYLDVEGQDQPARIRDRLFYRHRKQGQEQACICVRRVPDGDEQTLVDPGCLGARASVTIHSISADGAMLAYELRFAGSDAAAIHIVNVLSGVILADYLPKGYARGFAFTSDNSGFYYCHEIGNASADHAIRFHRLGASSGDDIDFFSVPRTTQSRLVLIADPIHLGGIYTHERPDGLRIDFYLAKHTAPLHWSPISLNKPSPYVPYFSHGRVFVLTEEGAPNRKLVEIFTDGSAQKERVPESDSLIHEVLIVENRIYISYLVDRHTKIHAWTLDGVHVGLIDNPVDGSIAVLSHPRSETSFFYSFESFIQPTRLFEYRADPDRSHVALDTSPATGPLFDCDTREVTYRSNDGTAIPMLLMMRADLDLSQLNPVLLTSYGGFGVSATPRFSVMIAILLELGVIAAMPSIRGGSEFGKTWHEAARGKNRQTSFDDFIRAAECLVAEGWTRPEELALYGASNSGLLVAVAMTQRPDLFHTVVCMGPLLDMVRYEQFDRAHRWRKEYGSVDNPDDFKALLGYSPYHHVQAGINYPSVLFVSGDSDDLCSPMHVRKMAALLQDREAQTSPIIVDYAQERGHRPGLPMTARIDAIARRTAFLVKELGLRIP